jgi:hypothetical protein
VELAPVKRNAATTAPDSEARLHFRDIASQAGITTVPHTHLDRHYVLDTMAVGGVALFDCDNDGKLDIVVTNDPTIEQYLQGGDLMLTLYHSDANSPTLQFTDITRSAGLTTKGWGWALSWMTMTTMASRICTLLATATVFFTTILAITYSRM